MVGTFDITFLVASLADRTCISESKHTWWSLLIALNKRVMQLASVYGNEPESLYPCQYQKPYQHLPRDY